MAGESPNSPKLKKYVRAVRPRLRMVLYSIFALVALLGANSAYLASITFLEYVKGLTYQNYFYQWMFLAHLALGLLLVAPVIVFGAIHIKNSHDRPNRRAVRVGYTLFIVSIVLLLTGVALMRFDFFSIKDPRVRSPIYWAHVITPLLAVWLYILHRLAGPRIKWRLGVGWGVSVAALVGVMVVLHSHDPRKWNVAGPKEGEKYFRPSLARTATGNFIPARTMMINEYCVSCHKDTYNDWFALALAPLQFALTTSHALFECARNPQGLACARWQCPRSALVRGLPRCCPLFQRRVR